MATSGLEKGQNGSRRLHSDAASFELLYSAMTWQNRVGSRKFLQKPPRNNTWALTTGGVPASGQTVLRPLGAPQQLTKVGFTCFFLLSFLFAL